jgi:hypothetical protein
MNRLLKKLWSNDWRSKGYAVILENKVPVAIGKVEGFDDDNNKLKILILAGENSGYLGYYSEENCEFFENENDAIKAVVKNGNWKIINAEEYKNESAN